MVLFLIIGFLIPAVSWLHISRRKWPELFGLDDWCFAAMLGLVGASISLMLWSGLHAYGQ